MTTQDHAYVVDHDVTANHPELLDESNNQDPSQISPLVNELLAPGSPAALLNPRIATAISSLSNATRLSLNCSAFLVECFFEGAKYGTQTGFDISRRALVAAVSSAREIHHPFYQVLDKYTNLGIYYIHSAFSLAELFTLTGVHLTATTLTQGIRAADESVRIVDGLFGSTETSRALAAFVSLVKREVCATVEHNSIGGHIDPAVERLAKAGTARTLAGILKALVAYACLQAVTWRLTATTTTTTTTTTVPPILTHWFPRMSLIHCAQRFMHYASAAYGPGFLNLLGMARHQAIQHLDAHHPPNHAAFARHIGIPLKDIIYSSYAESHGTPLIKLKPDMHALVNYICIDRTANAIVLTLRGTLGLSDILTDLTCSYAEFELHGRRYHTHSGMLESAQLLADPRSEVSRHVRMALEQEPNFGLVICGHSLGGGVAALLSLLCNQWPPTRRFVTATLSPLPKGRSIRCFAYASPCVADTELRKFARGLVTTIVHGHDIVPTLSLGVLHDFKAISVSLYAEHKLAEDIIARCVGLRSASIRSADWYWSLIKTLKADMTARKLYPPGDVYVVESSQERYLEKGDDKPRNCIRARMMHVRQVEERFGELVFAKQMLSDHAPTGYERCLDALASDEPILFDEPLNR
ncbi:hypothetical protein BDF19DRAFT_389500 [Syncephalis fuscata]|nr:hypothetical protein BDF19DRAFT_389500 [Syncephalis fuscata]